VVALLVLVSLTLISLDASGRGRSTLQGVRGAFNAVLAPVQSGIHAALRPVGNFFTGAVDYGRLQAENTLLRTELDQLRATEASAAFYQQQADQVLALQHLPFVAGIPKVTAQIINIGSSNFSASVTIDRGRSAGVLVGQPVVAAGGLAGSVVAVTAHTARVDLITDPRFVVGVSLPDHNTGSAAGQGPGDSVRVTVVPASAPVPKLHRGEILSTSGLQMELFPPGIPVGRIATVAVPPGELEPVATVTPFVNAARLGYVDVLLWSPQ
jgi:rod shape-determining protein MreC